MGIASLHPSYGLWRSLFLFARPTIRVVNSNATPPPKPTHEPHGPMFPWLESPTRHKQIRPTATLRISQTTCFPPLITDLISAKATRITTLPARSVTITLNVRMCSMLIPEYVLAFGCTHSRFAEFVATNMLIGRFGPPPRPRVGAQLIRFQAYRVLVV